MLSERPILWCVYTRHIKRLRGREQGHTHWLQAHTLASDIPMDFRHTTGIGFRHTQIASMQTNRKNRRQDMCESVLIAGKKDKQNEKSSKETKQEEA